VVKEIPFETNAVARTIVDAAFAVHTTLGPGLLESVYELCLVHELTKRRLAVAKQVSLPIVYDGTRLGSPLRMDLVVDHRVVVELKAIDTLAPIHTAQMLTYLKLSGLRLGLLINFNVALIRDGIKRVAR
jgi:GxxExxY protein